jgi:hypothetical protein
MRYVARRNYVITCAFYAFMFTALLDGCSGGSLQPSFFPPAQSPGHADRSYKQVRSAKSTGYVYVSNRTRQGKSELLVYRVGSRDPSPIQTITRGLVDVEGVAVDPSGYVYVANGSGRNVLKFAPGGGSLVFAYSIGLVHPIAVTVNDGTLYVTDQGDAGDGAQQVFEYTIGSGAPSNWIGSGTPSDAIAGFGSSPLLNQGIAVDSGGSQGAFFVSASTGIVMPPNGVCTTGQEAPVGENLLPTLWKGIALSHTGEPAGLAFDSTGKLYIADICTGSVDTYSYIDYGWTFGGNVSGTFGLPLFLTVDNDILAVPSYHGRTANDPGYVSVTDLASKTPSVTITKGLQHPIGAAAFY